MIDLGIFPGDIAVVDRFVTASDGRVMLGVLASEFTIKRYWSRAGNLWLDAAIIADEGDSHALPMPMTQTLPALLDHFAALQQHIGEPDRGIHEQHRARDISLRFETIRRSASSVLRQLHRRL